MTPEDLVEIELIKQVKYKYLRVLDQHEFDEMRSVLTEDVEARYSDGKYSFDGVEAESLLIALDLEGVAVSTGSACSSGKVKVPRVLRAMGLDDHQAECALRVSLGPTTSEDDVLRFAETWLENAKKARNRAA